MNYKILINFSLGLTHESHGTDKVVHEPSGKVVHKPFGPVAHCFCYVPVPRIYHYI